MNMDAIILKGQARISKWLSTECNIQEYALSNQWMRKTEHFSSPNGSCAQSSLSKFIIFIRNRLKSNQQNRRKNASKKMQSIHNIIRSSHLQSHHKINRTILCDMVKFSLIIKTIESHSLK